MRRRQTHRCPGIHGVGLMRRRDPARGALEHQARRAPGAADGGRIAPEPLRDPSRVDVIRDACKTDSANNRSNTATRSGCSTDGKEHDSGTQSEALSIAITQQQTRT